MPPWTNDVMVLPLFHSSFPVAESRPYSTAGDDRLARSAAASLLSLERNSPLERAKITPLITIGVRGDTISRETHPGCSAGAPFCSTTFQATTAPFVTAPFVAVNPASEATGPTAGASIQRAPSESCQLARAPGAKSAA